jgi:hypothetical protein
MAEILEKRLYPLKLRVIFDSCYTSFLLTPGITMITATEIFLGLFFRVLTKESPFGAKRYITRILLRYIATNTSPSFSLLAVTFVVADTSGDAITTKIYSEFQVFMLAGSQPNSLLQLLLELIKATPILLN